MLCYSREQNSISSAYASSCDHTQIVVMGTLLQQALGSMPHQLPHHRPGGRPQRQDGNRLQLREALAGLQQPDLQEQAMFACESLVRQSTDSPLSCLKELFRMDSSCPGSARRLRYR